MPQPTIVEIIKERVKAILINGPMKGVELVTDVTSHLYTTRAVSAHTPPPVLATIDAMVQAGEIIEVTYTVRSMPLTEKSMYFDVQSAVTVTQN